MAYFTGRHILLEGMSNRRSCLTGVYVLQEYVFTDGISYSMICHRGRHVLQVDRSYWCVHIIGGHAIVKGMS